ncbi:HNH endonuclease [Myxococcota bacterium]|nr:HNH endonuclease [Myxococcota bacterium]
MPLLYYWTRENYVRNMDDRDWFHLNQGSPLLREAAEGERLWAFTRNSRGDFVLAAELVITAKGLNSPAWTERYGPFRVWGSMSSSAYFDAERSPSVEALLRALSPKAKAARLGQSFQGHAAVRRLSLDDERLLSAFALDLPLHPVVHPEGRRDVARFLMDEELSVELALPTPQTALPGWMGEAPPPPTLAWGRVYPRDAALPQRLQRLYDGRCQLCGWDPASVYHRQLCEAHHIQWLSRGGWDRLDNLILLCPNHHRAVHSLDATLDFADLTWRFGDRREPIQLNEHLPRAA